MADAQPPLTIDPAEKEKMDVWLLQNLASIIPSMAEASIIQFSNEVLQDNKLVPASTKAGLNFFKANVFLANLKKLVAMVNKKVLKDIPHLASGELSKEFFNTATADHKIGINLIEDSATRRYIRKLQKALVAEGIPIRINGPTNRTFLTSTYVIEVTGSTEELNNSGDMYILMYFIPQVMQAFKTIQRKAIYARDSLR